MTITVTISNFSFPALRRDGAFVPHLCSVRNRRLWFCLKRCFRALRGSLDWEQVYCTKEYRRENGEVQKNVSQDSGIHQIRSNHKTHRAETKRFQNCCPIRLIQLSAVGEVFGGYVRRDTACRVRQFQQREVRWKHSTGMFPKSEHRKRDTGRSGLVRSALEKLSLFSPTFSVRQKHGAGDFAVCGQRLRGHVPSKNTSPAALSWSSLFGAAVLKSFCSCTMLFVVRSRDFTARSVGTRRAVSVAATPRHFHTQKKPRRFGRGLPIRWGDR